MRKTFALEVDVGSFSQYIQVSAETTGPTY